MSPGIGAELVARLLRPLARSGAVLCYHGIATERASPSSLHVDLAALQDAVAVARSAGHIVPVAELIRRRREGRSTAGLFAFTFDDAYLSLLTVAADFIAREEVPLTVFAVPAALDEGRRFWWDRVDHLVPRLSGDELVALFERLGIPPAFRDRHATGFGPARPLRQWVLARYAALWPHAYDEVFAPLEREKGVEVPDRSMTWDELSRFAALPTVDLGVHTFSHPALPLLSPEAGRDEIARGYAALRERIPGTLPLLAAPFGLFDAVTLSAARSAGMTATLTLMARTLRHSGPGEAIPRYCILREESKLKLALRLSSALDRWKVLRGVRAPEYPVAPSLTPEVLESSLGGGSAPIETRPHHGAGVAP